eukprot:846367-Rhodomonas_salina.2
MISDHSTSRLPPAAKMPLHEEQPQNITAVDQYKPHHHRCCSLGPVTTAAMRSRDYLVTPRQPEDY